MPYGLVAERFRALAHPFRLKLVALLRHREQSVSGLCRLTGAPQPTVSRHLKMLTVAGVLRCRKSGLQSFYEIADPVILELCQHVCAGVQRHLKEQAKAFERSE